MGFHGASTLLHCFMVALVAIHTTNACCSLNKWQAKVSALGGVAGPSSHHHGPPRPPKLIAGVMDHYYNAINETIASVVEVEEGKKIRIVANFTEGKAYVIAGSSCKYFRTRRPFRKLCTDNFTAGGPITFGAGNQSSLKANTWFTHRGGLGMSFATTQKRCLPISESIVGRVGRDYMVVNIGFFNISIQIKDPSIFNHPDSCKPAREKETLKKRMETLENHLDILGIESAASYFIRRNIEDLEAEEPEIEKDKIVAKPSFNDLHKTL